LGILTPITVPGDLVGICCLNVCPVWSSLIMGNSSASRDWQPCHIVFWNCEVFILEKTNLISKFKRQPPMWTLTGELEGALPGALPRKPDPRF
jgi:hypothetical protein